MGVAGVILAAEHAARLDRPKALLDFRGQPFVVQILQALEALEVKLRVVVLGLDAARIRPALAPYDCLIVETTLAGGSIEALRAALTLLQPLQPPGVLAWPVGLPHVRVDTIERHASEFVALNVDDPAVIDELETPEDYERLVRQINRDLY
jgi:bifunctional N-acetylglucosamine-1-phosphate-uridyltransferase/glucosamine-1-phosphate-acetyltransferase GlmU-like protein